MHSCRGPLISKEIFFDESFKIKIKLQNNRKLLIRHLDQTQKPAKCNHCQPSLLFVKYIKFEISIERMSLSYGASFNRIWYLGVEKTKVQLYFFAFKFLKSDNKFDSGSGGRIEIEIHFFMRSKLNLFMRSKFTIIFSQFWSGGQIFDHEIEIQKSIIRNFDLMIALLVTSTIMRSKFKISYLNLVSCTCG